MSSVETITYKDLAASYFPFNPFGGPEHRATTEQIDSIAKDLELIAKKEEIVSFTKEMISLDLDSYKFYEINTGSGDLLFPQFQRCLLLSRDLSFLEKTNFEKQCQIRQLCALSGVSPLTSDTRQKLYLSRVKEVIEKIKLLIDEKIPFYKIFKEVADCRKKIAYECYDDSVLSFGKYRFEDIKSPNIGRFLSIEDMKKAFKFTSEGEGWELGYKRTIRYPIGNEEIPLSILSFADIYNLGEEGSGELHVKRHTKPEYFEKIFSVLDELYDSITNDHLDETTLFQTVGKLHWWLTQASFLYRGSGATTEITCTALLNSQNQTGKLINRPGAVALTTADPVEFSQSYKERFWKAA